MGFLDTLKRQLSATQVPVMEHRLFRLLCLGGTVLSLGVIIPTNLALNLSWKLNLAVIGFGVALVGLYLAALRGRHHTRLLSLLLTLVLNLAWFSDGGSQGSISMFFFTGVILNSVFFRGRERILFLGGFLLNVILMFTLDFLAPDLVIPLGAPRERYLDLVSGFLISVMACLMMLWVLVSSHDEEQRKLTTMNADLKRSLDEIQVLQGMLPICGWCKKVRDDEGLWTQVEEYLGERTDLSFTHGMCPDCSETFKAQNQAARER